MAGKIKGLTVVIDGNTTKLSTAIKTVNAQAKSLQKELKGCTTLLAADPTNFSLIAQKQQLLNAALADQKSKLEMLRSAEAQYFAQIGPHTAAEGQEFRNLQREIAQTEQKMRSLTREAVEFGAGAETSLLAAEAKMAKYGESCEAAGKKMMLITAGIAFIGFEGVKSSMEFDTAMSQVAATMGMSAEEVNHGSEEMEKLTAIAKRMGATTKFTATEAAEGLNYLALAGYDANASVAALPTVLNLAAAGNMDLATASDLVTDALSALGFSSQQLAEDESILTTYADEMAKTASSANTSVQQLGEATLISAGTARTYGISLEEINTALGILANNGLKSAEGGTALRNAILNLYNASSAAAPMLEELGVTTADSEGNLRSLEDVLTDLNKSLSTLSQADKAKAIATIFDKRVIAPAVALLNSTGQEVLSLADALDAAGISAEGYGTSIEELQGIYQDVGNEADFATRLMEEFGMSEEDAATFADAVALSLGDSSTAFSDLKAKVEDASGACATMADTQLNNLEGSITLLKSAVDGALQTFGDALIPTIKQVAEGITSAVTAYNDLDEQQQQTIIRIGLLVAAAGPAMLILGRALKTVGNLVGAYASAKTALDLWRRGLTATQAIQTAMGRGAAELAQATEGAAASMGRGTSSIKGAIAAMGTAKVAALGLGAALVAVAAVAIVDHFKRVAEHAAAVRKATDGLREAAGSIPDAMSQEAAAFEIVSTKAASTALSVDELARKQSELTDAINERNATAQNDMAILQSCRNVIDELAGKAGLTSEEEGRLSAALKAVNDECGTSYALSGSAAEGYAIMKEGAEVAKDEILNLIDAQKQQIRFEAAKETYADIYSQQAEAAKTYAAALAQQKSAHEDLASALEMASAGLDEYGGATMVAASAARDADKAVAEAKESLDATDDALHEAEKSMGDAAAATEGTASTWEAFTASHQVIQATLSETGFSLEQFQDALAETGVTTDDLKDLSESDLALLAASYDGSVQSITDTLVQFGIDASDQGAAASQGFADNLSAGTQAAVSAALIVTGMTLSEFEAAAAEAGAEGDEAVYNFAVSLAAGADGAGSASAGVKDAALSGLDDNGEAAALGDDFNEGYIGSVGSWSAIQRVMSKAASLVRAAIGAARNEQDSASPSKVMAKLGDDFDNGYEVGIERSSAGAADASKKMVRGAIDSAKSEAKKGADIALSMSYKAKMEAVGGGKPLSLLAGTISKESEQRIVNNHYAIGDITLLAKDVSDIRTFDDFAQRLQREARCL